MTQNVWPSNCCAIAMWSLTKNLKSPVLQYMNLIQSETTVTDASTRVLLLGTAG